MEQYPDVIIEIEIDQLRALLKSGVKGKIRLHGNVGLEEDEDNKITEVQTKIRGLVKAYFAAKRAMKIIEELIDLSKMDDDNDFDND